MAHNGGTPETKKNEYNPTFTDMVIAATGQNAHPRLAEIMPSLLRHLHDFAREVDLTVAEWIIGVELVSSRSGTPRIYADRT
jgi:catechol 1,2-dioxygenase